MPRLQAAQLSYSQKKAPAAQACWGLRSQVLGTLGGRTDSEGTQHSKNTTPSKDCQLGGRPGSPCGRAATHGSRVPRSGSSSLPPQVLERLTVLVTVASSLAVPQTGTAGSSRASSAQGGACTFISPEELRA